MSANHGHKQLQRLQQHMDDLRAIFGTDPTQAEDYQKVPHFCPLSPPFFSPSHHLPLISILLSCSLFSLFYLQVWKRVQRRMQQYNLTLLTNNQGKDGEQTESIILGEDEDFDSSDPNSENPSSSRLSVSRTASSTSYSTPHSPAFLHPSSSSRSSTREDDNNNNNNNDRLTHSLSSSSSSASVTTFPSQG